MDGLRPVLERLHRTAADAQVEIQGMRERGVLVRGAAAGGGGGEAEKVERALAVLNRIIALYKRQTPGGAGEGCDGGDDENAGGAPGPPHNAVDDIETASELVMMLFEQQFQQLDIMKRVLTSRR